MIIRFSITLILFIAIMSPERALSSGQIPFSLKRGVPEIEVIINDSIKASFIIDTGADQLYIDKAFGEIHGLLSGGKMPMRPTVGVDEKVDAFQIFLHSLSVGGRADKIVGAVVIDITEIVKDTTHGHPLGIIGYSFLKRRNIFLNYSDSTMEFDVTPSDFAGHKSAQIPFTLSRHLIIVNTKINDSVDAKMILDTGASWTIFSPDLAKKLNFKDSSEVRKIRIAGKVTTANVKALIRDISDVTAAANREDIDGILGTGFLLGRRILIDYPNNQLTIFANQ